MEKETDKKAEERREKKLGEDSKSEFSTLKEEEKAESPLSNIEGVLLEVITLQDDKFIFETPPRVEVLRVRSLLLKAALISLVRLEW